MTYSASCVSMNGSGIAGLEPQTKRSPFVSESASAHSHPKPLVDDGPSERRAALHVELGRPVEYTVPHPKMNRPYPGPFANAMGSYTHSAADLLTQQQLRKTTTSGLVPASTKASIGSKPLVHPEADNWSTASLGPGMVFIRNSDGGRKVLQLAHGPPAATRPPVDLPSGQEPKRQVPFSGYTSQASLAHSAAAVAPAMPAPARQPMAEALDARQVRPGFWRTAVVAPDHSPASARGTAQAYHPRRQLFVWDHGKPLFKGESPAGLKIALADRPDWIQPDGFRLTSDDLAIPGFGRAVRK